MRAGVPTALRIAAARGYVPRYPSTFFDSDGESHVLDGASALHAFLARGGGGSLWRDDDAILLSTDAKLCSISFGVLHDLFADRVEDVGLAADLEHLFLTTSEHLEALYGYSYSEYALEAVMSDCGNDVLDRHRIAMMTCNLPPVLFRINYYHRHYWERIDNEPVQDSALTSRRLSAGVVVSLAEHPWDERIMHVRDWYADAQPAAGR